MYARIWNESDKMWGTDYTAVVFVDFIEDVHIQIRHKK